MITKALLSKSLVGMRIALPVVTIILLGAFFQITGHAADHQEIFSFKPILGSANRKDWNPSAPWKVPDEFTQAVVFSEQHLNVYGDRINDMPDMNAINESGLMAGRFLYRTHELGEKQGGAAVSVMDLKTRQSRILIQDRSYRRLDGNRWTPWGTLLVAEEVPGGRIFEITLKKDRVTAESINVRPALGLLRHEGIDIDADGNVYVIDEHRGLSLSCKNLKPCGGSVYKFVPDKYGDLSSGSLYVLKVTGPDGTGQGEWVGPIDPANALHSGARKGAQSYQRPEDVEVIGNTLYVAITEGTRDTHGKELYEGRVISIDLGTLLVSNFVKPGVNVPVEIGRPGNANHQTGFDSPDNLAESPDGRLVIAEDNNPADIWFASTKIDARGASKEVLLFASLADPRAEATGIYFGKDSRTLFVNVQHSAIPDGDATWAISSVKKTMQ